MDICSLSHLARNAQEPYCHLWAVRFYNIFPHYDMIYDIFVNCNWVATRWQQYSAHLHTNNRWNDTKIFGRVWAVPRLCELYPGICLQLRKKHRKPSVISQKRHDFLDKKKVTEHEMCFLIFYKTFV